MLIEFILPGQASIFIPKAGTAQLCITSDDVTKNLVNLLLIIVMLRSGLRSLRLLYVKSVP